MRGPAEIRVISKSYITGLIVKCGFFFAAGIILTGVILYYSAQQPLGPSYHESFIRLSQLKQEVLIKSILIYSILMIIIIAGVVITTLIYSHRVVGPTIALKRILKALAAGDLTTPAILRTKDAIKPMADALNNLMGSYRNTIEQIENEVQEMRSSMDTRDSQSQIKELHKRSATISGLLENLKL